MWKDPELERFFARWQHWGELMAVAGVTSAFTWLAAALPSAHQTHVSIWPPLLFAGVIGIAGIYTVLASHNEKWWLPGRKSAEVGYERRMAEAGGQQGRVSDDAKAIADALRSLGTSVQQIATRLDGQGGSTVSH